MNLKLLIKFYTDGDFGFRDIDNMLNTDNNPLYTSATHLHYNYYEEDYEIVFMLSVKGEESACRNAARDLMENIICNLKTSKYYLVKEIYDFIAQPLENELYSTNDVHYTSRLSGNYSDSLLQLDIEAAPINENNLGDTTKCK